jgi:probable HAF family extracellular repeat protein
MNAIESVRRCFPRSARVAMRLNLAVIFTGSVLLGCHETPTAPTPQRFESGPRLGTTITVGSYTLRDLGTLGGLSSSASGINDSGDIVGSSLDSSGRRRATVWPAGGGAPRDLGGFGTLLWSNSGSGINEAGNVAGTGPVYTFGQRGALWPASGGGPRDLGALPTTSASGASAINDAGDVVGVSQVFGQLSSSNPHATLWPASGGMPRDLGSLGGPRSEATAINSAGTIVGFTDVSSGATHATVWLASGGAPQDLGAAGAGDHSAAYAINDSGDIVGDANYAPFWGPGGLSHATLWRADGSPPRNLGTLNAVGVDQSFAKGINNAGDIVGSSYTANGDFHAVLWPADGSGPRDLGVLTGIYSAAVAINSSGVIVGNSRDASGQLRAVVWEPVRLPQSITFASSPPNSAIAGGTYTVSATGGASGNAVTFTSLAPTVCSVAGNAVSFDAGGTCTIAADQPGGVGYLAAAQVTQTFDINTRPVASAGAAQAGNEGSAITFSAANSSDADGDALITYTWDFGDGTVQSVSSPTVQHIYSDNKLGGGAYLVALQVTDARGATSAAANTSALINNIAPIAMFNPVSPVGEGTTNLSLVGVQDAAGDVSTIQYAFDCGNGTGYGAFSPSSSIACLAPNNGIKTVRAKLRDKDGGVSEYTRSLTVVNVAPAIAIISAPASGKVGVNYTLQFRFTDPGTGDAPWHYQVTWGDGKKASNPVAATTQGLAISQVYRYAKAGSYTISVRVTDKDGGVGTVTVPVKIVR